MGPAAAIWGRLPLVVRQMVRFGAVSATAFVVDVASYAALLPALRPAALAAFAAYVIGGVWHYLMSSILVFRHEMPNLAPAPQAARFGRYLGSTLAGLAVTTATVALLVDMLGADPIGGKLCAVPLSFATVFTMVRLSVFRTAAS